MEQQIEALLANLDSVTLQYLPCFNDRPDQIQFRIGLNRGVQIRFEPAATVISTVVKEYNLILTGTNQRIFIYPILIDSAKFNSCNNIHTKIRALGVRATYSNSVEENIDTLLSNLKNIVDPIIAKLP